MAEINKYQNQKWGTSFPLNTGDRYWAQDMNLDFRYLQNLSGKTATDITRMVPCIMSGGNVQQGSGDTLNISVGNGMVYLAIEIVDSFAATPPSKMYRDMITRVEWPAQTNMAIASATLDGSTVNYVKVKYKELDGNTRARAKSSGTYAYETSSSYEIVVDSTAPNALYDICLGSFVGSTGGTFVFQNTNREFQDTQTYDYVVRHQDDFNNLFTRNSAGNYSIRSEYKSVFFKNGTYLISTLRTKFGDTATGTIILNTNNCSLIEGNSSIIYYAGIDGYININTSYCNIFNLKISGDNSTSLSGGYNTFYLNQNYIKLCNCYVEERIGSVNGFGSNVTYNDVCSLDFCVAKVGTYGFFTIKHLSNCVGTQCGVAGFRACENISNSYSRSNTASGFILCNYITSSTSINNTNIGFDECKWISNSCYSTGSTNNFVTSYGNVSENSPSGTMSGTGDPLFTKFLSGTIDAGNSTANLAHGISNAYTNVRIVHHTVYINNTSTVIGGVSSGGSIPTFSFYDNTNVQINRTTTSSTYPCYAYVVYR